jgi:hypothetical protein
MSLPTIDKRLRVLILKNQTSNVYKTSQPRPAKSDSCFLISSSMASGDSGKVTEPPWASPEAVIGGTYLKTSLASI